MTTRRQLVLGLVALGALTHTAEAAAGPRRPVRRRTRRRTRRRIRRRHRRRVTRRVVAGRSLLVVPVALAVGWELLVDDRVYVVTAIAPDAAGIETATLTDDAGSTLKEAILREDTADNGQQLVGSEIDESDTTTPGVEEES